MISSDEIKSLTSEILGKKDEFIKKILPLFELCDHKWAVIGYPKYDDVDNMIFTLLSKLKETQHDHLNVSCGGIYIYVNRHGNKVYIDMLYSPAGAMASAGEF